MNYCNRAFPASEIQLQKRIQRPTPHNTENQHIFLQCLSGILDVLCDVLEFYAMDAEQLGLKQQAHRLRYLTAHPPSTLADAIQLWWLFTLLAGGKHLEGVRLDVAFGDFYQRDIANQTITEADAFKMVQELWMLFVENGGPAVCRVTIGGKGRRNQLAADAFARLALQVTAEHNEVIPQLRLRIYDGIDTELVHLAYDIVGNGNTFPMIFNDDAIIPGVQQALHVSEEDAIRYHPLGCGEHMIASASPGWLNYVWSLPRTLEAALFSGYDAEGEIIDPPGRNSLKI